MANLPTANNNPGDLRNVGQEGASEGAGGFAKFDSPQSGFGALLNDLQTKINNHPDATLADFSNVYAPPSENNSAQYAANLANQLGVAPNATIGSLKPEIGKFAEAIAANEGYQGSLPNLESSSSNSHAQNKTQSSNYTPAAMGVGAAAAGGGILATALTGGEDLLAGLGGDIGGWISGALGITDLKNAVQNATGNVAGGGGGNATPPPQTPTSVPSEGNGNKPQDNTEEQAITQEENQSSAQSTKALASAADGVKNMLQATQSGRVFSQNPAGQNAIGTAVGFNLIGQDENGNATFDENARKQALAEVSNLDDKISASSGGSVSPLLVSNFAGNEIARNRLMTASARQDTADYINSEMKSDVKELGPNAQITAPKLRELAKQHNAAAEQAYKEGNFTPTPKSMAHKALGRAYANALDKALEGDPHAQELHRRAMKMEEHLIRAKELKKYIHGKKIPKNNGLWESFLRQGARAAEIYIGEKIGGPVGAIIGGLLGEGLNRKITSKFGRNMFSTPGMRAAFKTLKDTKPKEYNDLVAALKKKGVDVPEDNEKPPKGKERLIKHILKEEQGFKGKKGLIKL